MKNVNRDYLVKVNVKTAEIETPKDDMIFYVTDIWTSNIFFQLDFGKGNSLTDLHKENASDYDLTLRVVKPNKEHKELKATLLSQDSNFFVADIPPDFINYIGICKCELFIETTINGRKETNTTDPFEYIVEGSVFSALDEVIEGRPDYPPLADKLATKEYVDAAVAAGVVGGVDLSGYVTTEAMNTALENKSDITHTHDMYVLSDNFYSELNNKANTDHTHTELHTHSNKSVLDTITAEKVASWDSGTGSSSGSNINLTDLVISNSISRGRKEGTAIGIGSIAFGKNVEASGEYSKSEGSYTVASGTCSHAEGYGTIASGGYSHAEGSNTTASKLYSHTEGNNTTASGITSHAEGYFTTAYSNYQHVQGKCNIEDTENKYAHIVGNGDFNESSGIMTYSNAHTLDWSGNGWYAGNLYVGGTSQTDANKVLSTADIKFTSDGKLSVTINGVTKKFNPA